MNKKVTAYIEDGEKPSEKVIKTNKEWLLEAYDSLGRLKSCNRNKNLNGEVFHILMVRNDEQERIFLQMKEINYLLRRSNVLEGDLDSVIGQILAKCAYPELLRFNGQTSAKRLIDSFAELIMVIEQIEGATSQGIAINESIKKLENLTGDIKYGGYNLSKVYTDDHWEKVLEDENNEKVLSFIKDKLSERLSIELDVIEKNTL